MEISECFNHRRIRVRVIAGSRKTEVIGFESDVLKVKVMPPAEKGAANRAVVKLLAEHFKLPTRNVILLQGESSRNKVFLLENPENKKVEK